ncbi:MAG: hypothetical protein IJU50_06830 [Lachnospiraceae bacterium]|nr:hypothetical protein [Lachnospiraceae bacterium]
MKEEILMFLDGNFDRPVIEMKNMSGILALIDTGARFPVWLSDVESLEALGGKLYRRGVSYSGIGGETKGDIYKLPSLIIGDGTHNMIYPEFPIVTNSDLDDAPFQMILSATMLHNMEYTINDKFHTLIIRIPDGESNVRNAVVRLASGEYQVLFASD